MKRKQHWENVYETKSDHDVGWFQESPEISLRLIEKYETQKDFPIIDIGGGNSYLSKILFDKGYSDITVLDISLKALERSQSRFGEDVDKIQFIESNVMDYRSRKPFHTWHDRAVFHFLVDEREIKIYAEVATKNIIKNGYLILGTFSLTGPKMCSGLPITQYSEKDFCKVFIDKFNLVECLDDVHITPSGNSQDFIWVVFKRK